MAAARAYVLTHHSVPNFGANLQAYATSRALAARGYAPVFVDFRPPDLEAKYAASVRADQRAAHERFASAHLTRSEVVHDQAGFEQLCARTPADLSVTGSDAVFRLDPAAARADLRFPNPYFLIGATGRKVAVSPSAMGCDYTRFPPALMPQIRTALAQMEMVSARDSWTLRQIRATGFDGPVTLTPDPVFSLSDLIRARQSEAQPERPYILLSTQGRMSPDWIARFTARLQRAGFDTLALPNPEGQCDIGATRQVPLPLSPLDWMALIAGSHGYVGGRFHPVVVALTAGLPVVALDLYHRQPMERQRSKTWLLMKAFGQSLACHSRMVHRRLTPGMVWTQLRLQMGDRVRAEKRRVADEMTARINAWYDEACPPVRSPEPEPVS